MKTIIVRKRELPPIGETWEAELESNSSVRFGACQTSEEAIVMLIANNPTLFQVQLKMEEE